MEDSHIISYSMNGKLVARHFPCGHLTISIYDVVSGVYMHDIHYHDHARTNPDSALGCPFVYNIWSHGQSLRFTNPEPSAITIWEVGFTPGATPMKVGDLSTPENQVGTFVFKPRKKADLNSAADLLSRR
jgi:hypothetical protein